MDPAYPAIAALAGLGLALIHVFAGKMRFLEGVPRSRWLSMAGGVSVAYVFLHLIPEVAEAQDPVEAAVGDPLGLDQRHVYLVALLGLATFYGLDRLAEGSREQQRDAGEEDRTSSGVFWIHIGSFAVYNLLIGYLLLHREERTRHALLFFFLAMALHFVVNDYGLREHHKDQYARTGRWIIAAAVLIGVGVGIAAEIPEAVIGALIAFLAGGVILNVLKEELPKERKSRFGSFALGTAGYAVLLLTL